MIYNFEGLTLQILTIDRFTHKDGFFRVNPRPYASLSYRISGTGRFCIDGRSLRVTPGDILYIPGDTPYEVEYSTSESIVVHLESCSYPTSEVFTLKNAEAESLFLRLLADWKSSRSVNRAKSTIYEILARAELDRSVSAAPPAFTACLQYIDAHFCDPTLDIGALCAQSFISVSGLHRAFLQYLGLSPMQYVIKLRMNLALRLLAENEHSVKEIALLCGFSDEKYFSRAVKQKYGYPPSRLRSHIMP